MADQKVGVLLDNLGVTMALSDGDMVTDVVVIAKNVSAAGEVSLIIGKSEATSWIDEIGLIHAAVDVMRGGYEPRET